MCNFSEYNAKQNAKIRFGRGSLASFSKKIRGLPPQFSPYTAGGDIFFAITKNMIFSVAGARGGRALRAQRDGRVGCIVCGVDNGSGEQVIADEERRSG